MIDNVASTISQLSDLRFTTTQRDVLLRFLMFSSRLAAWSLSQKNASITAIERWRTLMRQLALTAKLLRTGRFVQQFKSAAQTLTRKHQDCFLGYVTILRQLLTAVYMTCDNATILNSIGFVPWKGAKWLETRAFRVWFAAGLCGIVTQLYCFYQLRSDDASAEHDRQSIL
jgi:peroxin-11B